MNTEEITSRTLKFSVYISILVIIAGLILYLSDVTRDVLWFGILLLIISPFIGVIVTTFSLIREKDMKWVKVALVLIVISVIGMLLK